MPQLRASFCLSSLLLCFHAKAQSPTFVKDVKPGEDGPAPVEVTGEAGVVVTYIPFQDPAQAAITEIVTIPNDQGGGNVFYPGGWIWTLAAPLPEGQPVPPAPTQPPDQIAPDQTQGENEAGSVDEGEEVVVTGEGGVEVTYTPSQDHVFTKVTEITTTTREDDDSEVIIFPGGWIWSLKGSPPKGPIPPPPTQPPGVENDDQENEVTLTGNEGVSVTYFASQDPEYTEVVKVTTKASDNEDDDDLVIFPAGWIWKIKGPSPPGPIPPPPSGPPPGSSAGGGGGGDDQNKDNDDDDDDEDEEECSTTTTPPECTKTISTEMGECDTPTKCVSGEQSTTTTTISASQDVIIGVVPDFSEIPVGLTDDGDDLNDEDMKPIHEYFESEGISLQDTNFLYGWPLCKGGSAPMEQACLQSMVDVFCEHVNTKPEDELSETLDANDELKKRRVSRRALHLTSLQQREDSGGKPDAKKCGSKYYQFEWTGAEGDCNGSCEQALRALSDSCAETSDAINNNGKIKVSCGVYSYTLTDDEPEDDSDDGDDGDEAEDENEDDDGNEDEDDDQGDDGSDNAGDDDDDTDDAGIVDISPPFEIPAGAGPRINMVVDPNAETIPPEGQPPAAAEALPMEDQTA